MYEKPDKSGHLSGFVRFSILFFHDPTMLRALGGKLGEENQYGGKRGGFASYHKLKIVQRCVKIREGDAEINL